MLSQMVSAQTLLGYRKTLTLAPCTTHSCVRNCQRAGWQILPELSAYYSGIAMRACDLHRKQGQHPAPIARDVPAILTLL